MWSVWWQFSAFRSDSHWNECFIDAKIQHIRIQIKANVQITFDRKAQSTKSVKSQKANEEDEKNNERKKKKLTTKYYPI